VEQWNGRNAFVHPLRFDELLQQSHFLYFCNELKFHILFKDWKMLGCHSLSKSQFNQKADIAPLCCQPSMCVLLWSSLSLVMHDQINYQWCLFVVITVHCSNWIQLRDSVGGLNMHISSIEFFPLLTNTT